ncbi:MAG TPA: hypothetical protein VF720_11825 [Candidatus Eisenbacteria bacterium]
MRSVINVVAALSLVTLGAVDSRADLTGSTTYDVFVGGSRVGSERLTWTEADGGQVTLEGECVLEVGGISTTLRPSLTIDAATLSPTRYAREMELGDRVDELEAVFEGGKAVMSVKENGSSSKRSIKMKPAELVVDGHVMSLLTLVADRYDFDKGGEQDLTVFDTEEGKAHAAHAMVRGMGTFENTSGSWRMKRLTVKLENVSVDLLVDDAGRVPLISMPLRNMEARLANYAGNSKAEAGAK